MTNFLGKVYEIMFHSWLFSDAMSDYLWGYGAGGDGPAHLNKYILFWFIALFVGEFVSFLYYRFIDKRSWATFARWLFVGVCGSLLLMFVSIVVLWTQWRAKGTPLYTMAHDYKEKIDFSDLLGAGFSLFLLTFLFYFLCSLLLKRTSKNCAEIPFSSGDNNDNE